jgi:hypothetical protein
MVKIELIEVSQQYWPRVDPGTGFFICNMCLQGVITKHYSDADRLLNAALQTTFEESVSEQ